MSDFESDTFATGYARAVLLAVDVGNTQTVLGLYDGERLTAETLAEKIGEPLSTDDEL